MANVLPIRPGVVIPMDEIELRTSDGRLGFDVCRVDKGDIVTGCEVVRRSAAR